MPCFHLLDAAGGFVGNRSESMLSSVVLHYLTKVKIRLRVLFWEKENRPGSTPRIEKQSRRPVFLFMLLLLDSGLLIISFKF